MAENREYVTNQVENGTVILIAEIQQSSNTTFRVYDYQRRGADGKLRPLHLERAAAVLDYSPTQVTGAAAGEAEAYVGYVSTLLVRSPYFQVTRLDVTESAPLPFDGRSFRHLLCTDGEAALVYDNGVALPVVKGDSLFLPANFGAYSLRGKHCTFLCTQTLPR